MDNDLISRSALLDDIIAAGENGGMGALIVGTLRRYVLRQPAVDAVEVVRCKDCKYFKYGDYCVGDKMEHSHARENDFCSYGERRADDGA